MERPNLGGTTGQREVDCDRALGRELIEPALIRPRLLPHSTFSRQEGNGRSVHSNLEPTLDHVPPHAP